MSQAELNVRRRRQPGARVTVSDETLVIQHPHWGRLVSLSGWSAEARIERAWALT